MKKKNGIIFLEIGVEKIHSPGLLAPCTMRRVRYGNRIALRLEFQAADCHFIPGGGVAVDTGKRSPVLFGNEVLEILVDSESTKNRYLCDVCNTLSLKITGTIEEEGMPAQFPAHCTSKGCRAKKVIC